MYRFMCFLLFSIMCITSCHRDDVVDETKLVHDRLHGKYKILSSVSNEPHDVNLDGVTDTNMVSEITDLSGSELVIKIVSSNEFLFEQFWPEQYFGAGPEPVDYDPSVLVNYARQSKARRFLIDADGVQIHVQGDAEPASDSLRFTMPDAVMMEGANRVRVVLTKTLYTKAGWKRVVVETVYERYTMEG